MTSSMQFIRWILSHLTVIAVLSLIVYVYWNRNDSGAQENNVIAQEHSATQTSSALPKSNEAVRDFPKKNDENRSQNKIQGHSQDFNETVEAVKETLSLAVETVQLETEGNSLAEQLNEKSYEKHAIIEIEAEKKIVYPSDLNADSDTQEPTGSLITGQQENQVQQIESQDSPVSITAGSQSVTEQSDSGESNYNEGNVDINNVVNAEPVQQENTLSYTDKSIQEQIKERQKQLSNQMVSLISITMDKVDYDTDIPEVMDVEPIKPIIETREQSQLLHEARQAFDEQQFELAEEKYLQLMDQLPELPDVVGELANVYKTQQRQSDQIAMNTQFVKRLVDHFRFDEAWRVVSETNEMDQHSANKQRRIIYKKQKETNQ